MVNKKIETTQRASFECAYVTSVPYKLFQAHSYKLEVSVIANDVNDGIVLEFEIFYNVIKSILPDNRFIYYLDDPDGSSVARSLMCIGIIPCGYDFVITAENLVNYFANEIQLQLAKYNVSVEEVILRENPSSYTKWKRTN